MERGGSMDRPAHITSHAASREDYSSMESVSGKIKATSKIEASECAHSDALPTATSLVDYYMSTTPKAPAVQRRTSRSPSLGNPNDFSGIYSVWKSPTKEWAAFKSRGSSETNSFDSPNGKQDSHVVTRAHQQSVLFGAPQNASSLPMQFKNVHSREIALQQQQPASAGKISQQVQPRPQQAETPATQQRTASPESPGNLSVEELTNTFELLKLQSRSISRASTKTDYGPNLTNGNHAAVADASPVVHANSDLQASSSGSAFSSTKSNQTSSLAFSSIQSHSWLHAAALQAVAEQQKLHELQMRQEKQMNAKLDQAQPMHKLDQITTPPMHELDETPTMRLQQDARRKALQAAEEEKKALLAALQAVEERQMLYEMQTRQEKQLNAAGRRPQERQERQMNPDEMLTTHLQEGARGNSSSTRSPVPRESTIDWNVSRVQSKSPLDCTRDTFLSPEMQRSVDRSDRPTYADSSFSTQGGELPGLGLVVCNIPLSVVFRENGLPHDNLGTRINNQKASAGMMIVQRVLPNSPASKCDAIAVGDEILSINSICCRGRMWQDLVVYMSPSMRSAGNHEARVSVPPPLLGRSPKSRKCVHIISRPSSVISRGSLRQETLCHASLVVEEESTKSISFPDQKAHFDQTKHQGLPTNGLRSEPQTTQTLFPLIPISAELWAPSDVRTFLEWVFWRQGSGFSILSSEYTKVPTGSVFLAMSDHAFGCMGFTHEETRVIRCVLEVLHDITAETAAPASPEGGLFDSRGLRSLSRGSEVSTASSSLPTSVPRSYVPQQLSSWGLG